MSTTTTARPSIDGTLPPDGDAAVAGGELAVAVARGVDDWNPLQAPPTTSGRWVASAVYEPLMRTGADGTPEPWLAESVVPDETATTWTITLRPDVTFHDGGPLTAAAVKDNLEARASSPWWEAALGPIGVVTVTDDVTLEVVMNRPWFGFDAFLTGPGGWQAAPSTILDGDGDPVLDPLAVPVGTGPFAVDPGDAPADLGGDSTPSTIGTDPAPRAEDTAPAPPGGDLELVRHEGYWAGQPHLEAVRVLEIPDGRGRADSLAEGRSDVVLVGDPDGIVRFLDRDGYVQVEDVAATEALVELNTSRAPLDDRDLRDALVLATDPVPVAELFTDGLAAAAQGPWIEDQPWFDADTEQPAPDPERAATEIAAMGDDITIDLLVEPTVEEVQLAQAVAGQWEAAGVDVQLDVRPPAEIAELRARGDFEAALVHDYGIADPDHLVGRWRSPSSSSGPTANAPRIDSSEVDAALTALRATGEPAERAAAAADAVRAVNDERALLWIQHDVWALVASERVGGLAAPEQLGFARVDAAPTWHQLWLRPD